MLGELHPQSPVGPLPPATSKIRRLSPEESLGQALITEARSGSEKSEADSDASLCESGPNWVLNADCSGPRGTRLNFRSELARRAMHASFISQCYVRTHP